MTARWLLSQVFMIDAIQATKLMPAPKIIDMFITYSVTHVLKLEKVSTELFESSLSNIFAVRSYYAVYSLTISAIGFSFTLYTTETLR
jgi:hypothetical protein